MMNLTSLAMSMRTAAVFVVLFMLLIILILWKGTALKLRGHRESEYKSVNIAALNSRFKLLLDVKPSLGLALHLF